jgi:hypothetical protein
VSSVLCSWPPKKRTPLLLSARRSMRSTAIALAVSAPAATAVLTHQPFANLWEEATGPGNWDSCSDWSTGHCPLKCGDVILHEVVASSQQTAEERAAHSRNSGVSHSPPDTSKIPSHVGQYSYLMIRYPYPGARNLEEGTSGSHMHQHWRLQAPESRVGTILTRPADL